MRNRCQLCGEYIPEEKRNETGSECPDCGGYHCEKCSVNATTCFQCGSQMREVRLPVHSSAEGADIFAGLSPEERRQHPRRDFNTTIEYYFSSRDAQAPASPLKGVTKNVSSSGLCMYTRNPVHEGQEIRLSRSFLPGRPSSATVQWVANVIDDFYLMGMKFS